MASGQRGASMVEFSLLAVPILLAGLGCVEVARWFQVRQFVDVALLQGARAGITGHARPVAIESAFEQALLPLYASGSGASPDSRMRADFARRSAATGDAPWRIEVLNPSKASFADYADPALSIARDTGLAAINNDYQAEQHQRYLQQGRPQGAASGQTIYQANVLVLRLTYLHEPLVPGVAALLRQLGDPAGSYAARAMALGGYLPMVRELRLGMQSHPVDWPQGQGGKMVARQEAAQAAPRGVGAASCDGLWCLRPSASGGTMPGAEPDLPVWPDAPLGDAAAPNPEGPAPGAGPSDPAGPGSGVTPDDPACGVSLCCVPA
ncbi:pilus assembly protein [Candidimonas humi]|uniref:TadE/TadG family type IV pilus assembly protein n=1 Tax=Candidimonas humi TaxID=683355 RepID=A0ABV8NTI2_9BURK|nr:TadE/TadG family type IV pilus assembly protein [Candidimonas humi]MBV6305284.1 pilus assembly protein [Candidimonas humi]